MRSIDEIFERCASLRAAARPADPADIAWLVACFEHPMKVVQRAAGDTLAALPDDEVGTLAAALDEALGDGAFGCRWVAAWTWSRRGRPPGGLLLDVLLDAIGADDGDIRWSAARLLTAGDPAGTLSARLLDLAGAGNAEQRKMAVYCLRDLGRTDAAALAAYRAALTDPTPGVRLAAMSALARATGRGAEDARRIARLLDDADGGVRRAAAATAGRIGVADPWVRAALRRATEADDEVLARVARAALERPD